MSLQQDVDLLRNIPLFAKIEPSKLKLLAFTAERLTFNQGDGTDTILDYQDGVDRMDLSSFGIGFGNLRIVDSGANVLVFYDEADPSDRGLVVISGHSASDMDSSDFIFA